MYEMCLVFWIKEICESCCDCFSLSLQLPLFINLCKDEVWGVRKACADVFPDVSASSNLGVRHDQLTPMFLKLLHDDSRWVSRYNGQCVTISDYVNHHCFHCVRCCLYPMEHWSIVCECV